MEPFEPGYEPDDADRQFIEDPIDGPVCRVCGCSDEHACEGGCIWYSVDLCSKCVKAVA